MNGAGAGVTVRAMFPTDRPRRLRRTETLRSLVRETQLLPKDFMLPLFTVSGRGVKRPIGSMPGVAQLSVDNVVEEARAAHNLGVRSLRGTPMARSAAA